MYRVNMVNSMPDPNATNAQGSLCPWVSYLILNFRHNMPTVASLMNGVSFLLERLLYLLGQIPRYISDRAVVSCRFVESL